MALESDGEASPKRRRVDGEGEQGRARAEAEAAVDHISALPKELRLHILSFLPLTSAIRTGALSTVWRGLWRFRWPAPSSLRLRVSSRNTPEQLLESLDCRGPRRVDRFSLIFFHMGDLERGDFGRCLDYAAACAAEDLLIHFVYHDPEFVLKDIDPNGQFTFRFPHASPLLARVSLRGVTVNLPLDAAARPFSTLLAIHLHSVEALDGSVRDLVAACPRLHTLDLRDCRGGAFSVVDVRPAGVHLRSLTVARCGGVDDLFADTASGLRSFRYSGRSCIGPSCIPTNAPLDDLCNGFRTATNNITLIRIRSRWLETLANFSNLTVLTICSSSLPRAPVSAEAGSESMRQLQLHLLGTENTNFPGSVLNLQLQNLRELHLLIFVMDDAILADIYEFFRTCRCPQLERLFVQLPKIWYHRKFMLKKSSEDMEVDKPFDELSEEEASVEELSQEEPQEEEASVDKLSQEEPPKEVPLEELSEDEASVDELSEEEALEDELPEDEVPEDELPEEETPEDELSEEEALEDELPEEEVPEDELSEEDLLEDGLENLVLVKIVNFNGLQNEMKLVSSLLRKATSLNKLLLVAPKRGKPGERQEDRLDKLHYLETELLLLRKASGNAQVILRESDDAAIQPVHSKVTAEFF